MFININYYPYSRRRADSDRRHLNIPANAGDSDRSHMRVAVL